MLYNPCTQTVTIRVLKNPNVLGTKNEKRDVLGIINVLVLELYILFYNFYKV